MPFEALQKLLQKDGAEEFLLKNADSFGGEAGFYVPRELSAVRQLVLRGLIKKNPAVSHAYYVLTDSGSAYINLAQTQAERANEAIGGGVTK